MLSFLVEWLLWFEFSDDATRAASLQWRSEPRSEWSLLLEFVPGLVPNICFSKVALGLDDLLDDLLSQPVANVCHVWEDDESSEIIDNESDSMRKSQERMLVQQPEWRRRSSSNVPLSGVAKLRAIARRNSRRKASNTNK